MSKDQCGVFEDASVVHFATLVMMTFAIFLSYVPQYRRIYLKKTSEGLSASFLFLGSASSILTVTNIILVSSKARGCCSSLSVFDCLNSQLSLLQIGTQCVCAVLILVVVLVITKDSIKQDKEEYARIVNVGNVVALHGLLSVVQIVVGLHTSYLYPIANANGLLSTALTMVKYVPQIYTTYKLKHPGTLSVGMMCIQTPGGFILTADLFFTKGSHWSSWVSYFTAASFQGALLTLCIYYEYFKNHGLDAELGERRALERIVEENVGAEEPLLAEGE
ncbi:mannosyltransferase [Suhomyces tanzawaensis NRRL Y-17324]|uniref:Mannosyltransferase n=1 Tax=Suhomyces tanzawaensis NRRL Y-17324 TaxID=984487 RepID=A0A1E4SMP3_9ASCO|nr:mannosyltransferase [Suhomyces tanzawaensis NRRL Y-17324]ODV80793.1 mannosyltransferase [Suhomyces tanzawaensis NRRL Y-17324]